MLASANGGNGLLVATLCLSVQFNLLISQIRHRIIFGFERLQDCLFLHLKIKRHCEIRDEIGVGMQPMLSPNVIRDLMSDVPVLMSTGHG